MKIPKRGICVETRYKLQNLIKIRFYFMHGTPQIFLGDIITLNTLLSRIPSVPSSHVRGCRGWPRVKRLIQSWRSLVRDIITEHGRTYIISPPPLMIVIVHFDRNILGSRSP